MERVQLSDNKEQLRGGWNRSDARHPSSAPLPLRLSPGVLKRRLRKVYVVAVVAIVFVGLRYVGWLGDGGEGYLFGASRSRSRLPDTRGWLKEKWFTDYRANHTAKQKVEEHNEYDAELYGNHEGSSELVRGLLQGPGERANAAAINIEHLHNWLRFSTALESHDGDDRISFAHMAFQTATYARILHHINQVPDSLLQQFEEKLWYFIPGMERIRTAQGFVAGQQQQLFTEEVPEEEIPVQRTRSKGRARLRRIANRLKSRLRRRGDGIDVPAEHNKATEALPDDLRIDVSTTKIPAAPVASKALNRGLVTVAGDEQMEFVVQLIATIRDAFHCDIPIEVFYHDEDDMSEENRAYLETTFASVRTVSLANSHLYDDDFSQLAQSTYSMRSFALLATNFTEVVMVDADTVLTVDPHDFFFELGYSKIGTLFFRDLVVHDMKNVEAKLFISEQLGQRKPSEQLTRSAFWRHELAHMQDSGVVVVNKANPNVFAALVFAAWQNSAWLREQITYHKFFGDKETYWLAFELAGLPYHFSAHEAGAIGAERSISTGGFCAEHQLHLLDTQVTHTHTPIASDEGHVDDEELPRMHIITSTKEGLQRRRVAWWNGSLMKSRTRGKKFGDLDAYSTVWAMDGRWSWQGDSMCLTKYTRRNARQLGISPPLDVLLEVGKTALRHMNG